MESSQVKNPKGHAMNEDVMKPTAWMIRDQNGAVYWDETECVFSNKQAAEDCACGLTDGAQDGEVFSVFPLYAAPAQPVEAVAGEAAFRRCVEALREMRIAFPDPNRGVYLEATAALAQADAALAHPRPTGDAHE